jgi:hypothetical protein
MVNPGCSSNDFASRKSFISARVSECMTGGLSITRNMAPIRARLNEQSGRLEFMADKWQDKWNNSIIGKFLRYVRLEVE